MQTLLADARAARVRANTRIKTLQRRQTEAAASWDSTINKLQSELALLQQKVELNLSKMDEAKAQKTAAAAHSEQELREATALRDRKKAEIQELQGRLKRWATQMQGRT